MTFGNAEVHLARNENNDASVRLSYNHFPFVLIR
jgi:hypothetical protein